MSTQMYVFTEHRGGEQGSVGRLDRGAIVKKALWRITRRKRLSGPGGRLHKTKPSSFPESPPVQPISGRILIWLMIWILQVQPDYNSWALGGPQDYKPSQLTSDKQTWVTQCQRQMQMSGSHTNSIIVRYSVRQGYTWIWDDVMSMIQDTTFCIYITAGPGLSFKQPTDVDSWSDKLNVSEGISSQLLWSVTSHWSLQYGWILNKQIVVLLDYERTIMNAEKMLLTVAKCKKATHTSSHRSLINLMVNPNTGTMKRGYVCV